MKITEQMNIILRVDSNKNTSDKIGRERNTK